MNGFKGSKYESGLDVATIAKRVRADLKAAVAGGALPKGFKASVRIDRYSMGCSLDVRVTACPGVVVADAAYLAGRLVDPDAHRWSERHTPAARALLATVDAIVKAYKRDDSDLQSDSYSVNFSDSVDFDSTLERTDREAVEATLRPAVAAALAVVAERCLDTLAARGDETDDRPRTTVAMAREARQSNLTEAEFAAARAVGMAATFCGESTGAMHVAAKLAVNALLASDAKISLPEIVNESVRALAAFWVTLGEPGDGAKALAWREWAGAFETVRAATRRPASAAPEAPAPVAVASTLPAPAEPQDVTIDDAVRARARQLHSLFEQLVREMPANETAPVATLADDAPDAWAPDRAGVFPVDLYA